MFSLFKALPKFQSRIGPRYYTHTIITRSEQFVWSLQVLYRFRKVMENVLETIILFQSYMCIVRTGVSSEVQVWVITVILG